MGRLIAVITAITLLAPAGPAAAAELTRVASSGEKDDPFDLDLTVRWERGQRRATITREYAEGSAAGDPTAPFAAVKDLQQLQWEETTNLLVSRVAIGLWEDLELSAELPYYLAQESTWKLASGVGGPDLPDTISGNAIDPDGQPCTVAPCPLFTVDPAQTIFQGGTLGDLKVGLSWGILSQARDDTKPTWVVGFQVTFPTAELYDPAAGRNTFWDSPYVLSSNVGPVGQKVWRYDLQTAISRRLGPVDPYLRANLTFLQKSSGTYSNCDHAAELAAVAPPYGPQGRSAMAALCAADPTRWGARLPWYLGLTFGTELVPYEDAAANQKIAFDVRFSGEYTSASRWYNELTHATGKLLATGSYLTVSGRLGLLLRASEYVSVQAAGTFGWASSHDLTGEDLDSAAANPNFDWRYDAPGRRFRATEATVLGLEVSGMLSF
jgi:hypothetical protein